MLNLLLYILFISSCKSFVTRPTKSYQSNMLPRQISFFLPNIDPPIHTTVSYNPSSSSSYNNYPISTSLTLYPVPSTEIFPYLPPPLYSLIALSGAFACSFTHLTVLPLDVLKTRRQVPPSPSPSSTPWDGALPTILGYTYYGLTVYPTYNLLIRTLPDVLPLLTASQSSLLSGSGAAVVGEAERRPAGAKRQQNHYTDCTCVEHN